MRSKAIHILSVMLLTLGTAATTTAQSVFPDGADQPKSKIKILGNVYGGGDQATVQGNTTVTINKGQYAGEIFGGGNGALYDGTDGVHSAGTVKASADIGTHNDDGTLVENTGATSVTINGGEMFFDNDHPSNHNIYGGGNMACNIAGSTNVQMNVGMVTWFTFLSNQLAAIPAWYNWYDQAMNPNTQKTPIIALFGAGYGAHTDVAGNTNVNVNIPGTADIHPADGTAFTHAELESIDQIVMRWLPDHRMVGQFVSAVHGGGYDGTVGAYDKNKYNKDNTDPTHAINYNKTDYLSQTNVSIMGQPFIFHVYGGGLGSKTGADANGGVNSHVGAVYGATKVDIQGGIINGDVFGGGAGIAGQATIPNPFPGAMGGSTVNLPYTYAAQVMRETDVTISGNSTVIFGNVYGGGDIANTGWYVDGARPTMTGHVEQQNHSLGVLDYTTSLNLNGGNILGKVFGGGNGRKKSEVEQYKFVGAVIGSTNVSVNGSKIWNTIYGGGNTGCVYSCQGIAATQGKTARTMATATFDGKDFTVIDGSTNVAIFDGFVAQDIFGGGYGDDPIGDPEQASSADIYGNTFVYFERGQLEYSKYWKPREIATDATMGSWEEPNKEVTGHFLPQCSGYDAETDTDYRNTESDITHNLYGGGNKACTVKGHTHVYMTGAPVAPADFKFSDYYTQCIANVAKPHFSVFGGGFGALAIVDHNAYSDINLREGTGFHSIIGGGMNGPVGDTCLVHVGNDPNSRVHHVYGGGYYAPCKSTELQITRGTILENVFGGSVMGNIWAENDDPTKVATTTIIGLQNPIDGKDRHSSADLDDENGIILRSYTYAQHQNQITIGGNVYGANDVSGTVNGVASLTIYGGTIRGDVYGAGNGDHIGYYVPNELRYDLGAHGSDNYFAVVHDQPGAPNGNTYVGRPQTIGGVELTLEGNTTDERVTVLGQVFGGGNSCTIGAWDKNLLSTTYFSNPHLVRDDPRYFLGGGKIDMNLGSHITIGRTHAQLDAAPDGANYLVDVDGTPENVSGLYMGCSGRHLATQDWSKTDNYYHHYYDASTAKYWPGFAVYQDNSSTPLTRQEGLQSFLAYMNNILVWSDNVNLNIDKDADDIWISNFVGGGFRGSMKAKTAAGQFHYTLPRGVTIGHDVIGGAFNTDVVYRIFETSDGHTYTEEGGHYKYLTNVGTMIQADEGNTTGDYHHIEYAANGTDITGIVRFYYDGGMLSELPYGTDKASNDRINRILKKYSTANSLPVDRDVNKDFTGTGLTDNKAFNYYKHDALVYLELDNRLEVEYVDGHVHGGNVFGGCFSSGRVEGDIWTDYRCFQESQQANSEDFNLSDRSFANAKDFETNFAMMLFGAGYGKNTNIQGSAYVRVLHPEKNPSAPIPGMAYGYPRLYNVFGGSYEGKVEGNTNIYFNPGKYGYVTGAIYGGGCNGYVGGKTYLELAGGYIDEAYGGARNANVGGGTHIWAYDGSARWWGEDVIHSNGNPMIEADAEKAPLFIGKLYGGTDISGQICTDEAGTYDSNKGYQPYYTAEYWPKELTTTGTYDPLHPGDNLTYIDTYLQVGGIHQSDNGFPIIGSVYAAGNGENTKAFFDAKYAITNKVEDQYSDSKLPHQHSALMEVSDGNIVYAFGGGNRATVTGQNYILVRSELGGKHTVEDLGVQMYEVMKKRILSVGVDCYDEKLVDSKRVLDLKNASIQRLFGGNNIATMSIQPKWSLQSGRVNNVYSGGNMGDMTYYNEAGKPATTNGTITGSSGVEFNADGSNSNYTPRGLCITIEHPEIHIGSLYGGCRLSDVIPGGYDTDGVTPLKAAKFAECEDYYGATVNITDGYIENVYGGNDISGTVHFGTNVNISGAVSGNVYGSGNGFYLYKWDDHDTQITEHLLKEYDPSLSADDKTLCYTVPASAAHGGTSANNTDKLLTINDARPSVEKAFLNIAGLEHYTYKDQHNQDSIAKRVAYVKGNVFCGGNASTITGDGSFSKFKIGSYVTLNGVFMGSDGYAFTQDDQIAAFAKLNGFTNMGEATVAGSFLTADDATHNPILLNVYMMAVDMKAHPKDFNLNLPLTEAHIGTYCGGGNRGSMLVDKMVSLPFHHDIIIYDKIVGACLDANIKYNQNGTIIRSNGGYSRAVDVANNGTNGNTKMRLDIASQFVPLVMDVPADRLSTTLNAHGENFEKAVAHDFLYSNQTKGQKYTYTEFNDLFQAEWPDQATFESTAPEEIQWKEAPGIYAPACNIYGGCYQSGEVEGDIELNLHTNMLRYVNKSDLDKSIAKNIACFNVYGAGFGQDSHVWGNVHINVDRSLNTSTMGTIGGTTVSPELKTILTEKGPWDIQNQDYNATPTGLDCSYPSFNNIIGGGRNGKLIGNSTIELRNGLVYTDVAGGCYASDMYGSTHVIVGYPKYYRCKTSGEYELDRADKWNTERGDGEGGKVIKQRIKYLKGDLVPDNVYQMIVAKTAGNAGMFDEVTGKEPSTANGARGWNDVFIKIGKGIYGGGYSLANSTAASAGNVTTHKLRDDNIDLHPHTFDGRDGLDIAATAGYGGNSSIMVGDQDGGSRDHIHISTLDTTVANIPATSSVIGKFIRESDGRYTHQGDGAPDPLKTYYTLSGDGGIYGDGHLTFCEGFRAADVTRYGWAEGTPKHPILMNTFQRMDLLSINDCCLMLQGAQDFATDQIDATVYSITRINELRMNSSLDATQSLGQISAPSGPLEGKNFDYTKQRNYLAFFNNVHYLGSIVTNDPFNGRFHRKDGSIVDNLDSTYIATKQTFIDDYKESALDSEGNKTAEATTIFKQRNVATARNAIGINNGYCLRIQNQEYEGTGATKVSKQYYGPIVGVCEVKLLTLVQGEGGGYVYADNIHEAHDARDGHHNENDYFLMTSGNFVFPGIIEQGKDAHGNDIGDQFIVDDCFLEHFGEPLNITQKHRAAGAELDEAHYWYVEGNRYFFTTTLTGFTYQKDLIFNLTKTDPNIILSGLGDGANLNIKKIEWLSTESGFHRDGYQAVLPNDETSPEKTSDYEFDIEIGGYDTDDWKSDMPRYSVGADDDAAHHYTHDKTLQNSHLPQFNIKLQDKLDNSGDLAYINHLDEPELVKVYLQGEYSGQVYEYTITVNIVYLQGPTVTGGVKIDNCALPGELIGFSTDGLTIKTPELMPVTAASWQILPLKQINADGSMEWDMEHGIVIPDSRYAENLDGDVEGTIRALYKQNEYNIAYIFTAGGYDFPVMPAQTVLYASVGEYNTAKGTSLTLDQFNALPVADKVKAIPNKEERMIVVHNYHRMKDVLPDVQNLQIETMPFVPDYRTEPASHHSLAEAKLYIEDEADLRAFINYLNMAAEGNDKNIPVGLTGLDIILQKDITLTQPLPAISQAFAGTFHGDGYHIDLGEYGSTFLGSNLTGKVYNLGLIGGTISSVDTKASNGLVNGTHTVNSYEYAASDDFQYGHLAYDLSHAFNPTTDHNDYADYVANRYANGDYQYATTDRVWSLRTGAPNYGNMPTRHNDAHTHDAARWDDVNKVFVPLYDGTAIVADRQETVGMNIVTYHGLPANYANDYLFFGQHLDKENADAYPVHIEPIANGDPSNEKGGNRVYKTSGFYGSAADKGFYYNRDAWALQPTLTAIDFTFRNGDENNNTWSKVCGRNGEGDDTNANTINSIDQPLAFHVNSNADYNGGTYDNASYGHVTQNLIVIGENATENPAQAEALAAGTYPNNTPEEAIRYHRVQLSEGAKDVYEIDYLHLVDKQDFNSPISLTVNSRAWYERYPQTYRNVDGGYDAGSAWEGVTLPFMFTTKVSGEPQTIDGNTYENVLSHFYGETTPEMEANPALNNRTLHHEYWLTGLVAADNDKATFARPTSSSTSGNFYVAGSVMENFPFENEYYRNLPNYDNHYDSRDDEGADVMGQHNQAWYAVSHNFDYYPLQFHGVPYLCAFPGNDFYEFSLEGDAGAGTHDQKVTFEVGRTIIAVSDLDINNLGTTTVGTHQHVGTYMHQTDKHGVNDGGTAFVAGQTILPFRTYMTTTASPAPQRIYINGSGDNGNNGDAENPGEEGGIIGALPGITITPCDGLLKVESSYRYPVTLPVYNVLGMEIMDHVAFPGTTFLKLPEGVYIVHGQKFIQPARL